MGGYCILFLIMKKKSHPSFRNRAFWRQKVYLDLCEKIRFFWFILINAPSHYPSHYILMSRSHEAPKFSSYHVTFDAEFHEYFKNVWFRRWSNFLEFSNFLAVGFVLGWKKMHRNGKILITTIESYNFWTQRTKLALKLIEYKVENKTPIHIVKSRVQSVWYIFLFKKRRAWPSV